MKTKRVEDNQAQGRGETTVKQAGARGGNRTLELHGREFFSQIGRRGGRRTTELYRELLSEFGKRGGRPRRPAPDQYMGGETSIKGGDFAVGPLVSPPATLQDRAIKAGPRLHQNSNV